MKRYKILHKTSYEFGAPVRLLPHIFRFRPREGHELRIESSRLDVSPAASIRWHRDVEGNSIATASFTGKSRSLIIESEVIIQKYDLNPLDFLISNYALNYPFDYLEDEKISLTPYLKPTEEKCGAGVSGWIHDLWNSSEKLQTFTLLNRLNERIYQNFTYIRRDEEGVQTAEYTVNTKSGSCRDFANFFMVVAQSLGFATRFISGYIFTGADINQPGSTHAWVEVFIPGAGWTGFDPTFGTLGGVNHIATAVARRPEQVPPVSGSFFGFKGSSMNVKVWVTEPI